MVESSTNPSATKPPKHGLSHGLSRVLRGGALAWGGVLVFAAGAGVLGLILSKSLVFYVAPSAVAAGTVRAGVAGVRPIRLGGLVVAESVQVTEQGVVFTVADLPRYTNDKARTSPQAHATHPATLTVRYAGVLPPLFGEGEEVIVEGRLTEQGIFTADSVFSRHDEEYRPVSRETAPKPLYRNR